MKRCWKDWLRKAGIRALRTVAQTALAAIGTSAVISEINWLMVGSTSLLAGLLSLLTSLAGTRRNARRRSKRRSRRKADVADKARRVSRRGDFGCFCDQAY